MSFRRAVVLALYTNLADTVGAPIGLGFPLHTAPHA